MKVKCVICDKIEDIADDLPLAKKLRNRPIHTYMCIPCNERIEERTKERVSSGNFKLYKDTKKDDSW